MGISYRQWLEANKESIDSLILQEAFNWINQFQNHYGVTKPASQHDLLGDKEWTSLGFATNTSNRDKVYYRTRWYRDKNDVNQISLQFNCFQGGGDVQTFNSGNILYQMYEKGKSIPTQPITAPIPPQAIAKAKAKTQAKAQAEKERKAHATAYFTRDIFPSLSENGKSPYFSDKKALPDDYWQGRGLRFGNDATLEHMTKNGNFVAAQLNSARNDEPLGLQLIYDDGTKKLTYGTDKSKAPCATFGAAPKDATFFVFSEGLADALINLKAFEEIEPDEKVTAVFAVDAANMIEVTKTFSQRYPATSGVIICDNDQWKLDHSDNVGVLKGGKAALSSDYKYVIPTFSELHSALKPTDVSDLFRLGGIDEVVKQLRIQRKAKYNSWPLHRLQYIGLDNRKPFNKLFKAVKFACHRASEHVPLQSAASASQAILNVLNNVVTSNLSNCKNFSRSEMDRLKEYVPQQIDKNIKKATDLSRPLADLTADGDGDGDGITRYDLIKDKDGDGKYRIDQAIAQQVISADGGLHIVVAPKNTGKTFSVIKPAVKLAMDNVHYPTCITHLISLTADIAEKCGLDNYQNISHTNDTNGLAITVNSVINDKFPKYLEASQVIVIDEIDAVIEAIETGTVKAVDRKATYEKLEELLRKKKVIVTGADIDSNCLEKLRKARQSDDIHLYIANPAPVLGGFKVINDDDNQASCLAAFRADVVKDDGIPCILASDNIKLIEAQNEELVKEGIKTLCITSNNGDTEEVKEFFQNPNEYIRKHRPQALLYTPKLSSGLSIDEPHFKRVYGVYNQQISEKGFLQMIARSRPTMEYRLAFPSQKTPNELKDEAVKRMMREMLEAYCQTHHHNYEDEDDKSLDIDVIKQRFKAIADSDLSDFTKQRIEAIAAEPFHRNPNNILLRLQSEGATIIYPDVPASDVKEHKAEHKRIKEEYKELIAERLISADMALSEKETEEVVQITQAALVKREKGEYLDTLDEAALIRHDYYRTEPFNEWLIEFHKNKGGLRVCRFVETSLTDPKKIKEFDRVQAKALDNDISQLGNESSIRRFNNELFNAVGITFYDEVGTMDCFVDEENPINWKSESVQNLVKSLIKQKDEFNGCMRGTGVRFTNKTARSPMRFIGDWLKLSGFKLKAFGEDRPRNYYIDCSDFDAFVVPYLIGRKGDNKNSIVKKTAELKEYINVKEAEKAAKQAERLAKDAERREREAAKRAKKAEREALRRSENAMSDAQNQNQPIPAAVDEPSAPPPPDKIWMKRELSLHARLEDFFISEKGGTKQQWEKIKSHNWKRWVEIRGEFQAREKELM